MKYGDALPADFNIPTSAFWLRNDLKPSGNPFALLPLAPDTVVMDCGAYIGTFAAACIEQGARHVYCYEAAPKNAALLCQNMERYGQYVTVVEAALTSHYNIAVALTMSGFSGANSIVPSENRPRSIVVGAINFRDTLLAIRPQVVKLDVEGAEYDLLLSLRAGDLSTVDSLFVEFHPIANREAKIAAVESYIKSEGLTVVGTRRRAFTAVRDYNGFVRELVKR